MQGSGWMALAEASGVAAGAAVSVCCHLREDEWPATIWVEAGLRHHLVGWAPQPCKHDQQLLSEVQQHHVLFGQCLPVRGLPPRLEKELQQHLGGSVLAHFHLRGRPPAMLWLGFRQPPDRDRILALLALIEAVGDRLPSRQQLFIEQAPLAFLSADPRGIISGCNAAIQGLGYSPEELVGKPAATLYPPGERERVRALIPSVGLGHREATFRHRSGEVIPVDVLVGYIRDDDGEVLEIVGLGRDLRPERRLEHHRRLEAVGRLVAGVAHELNNPLLTVVGNAEMLISMKVPAVVRRRLERVLAGARRCQDVVDSLLRLRIKRKQLEAVVELEPLLHQAVRVVLEDHPASQPLLDLSAESLQVKGDAADLEQAIGHLLRNACQAVDGRPESGVKLKLAREGDMARIAVEDSGPGMSAEVLGRAFEPFFTTREVGQGRGLGLSIAMGVVQDHGGYMELSSGSQGTVVVVNLPLLEPAPPR